MCHQANILSGVSQHSLLLEGDSFIFNARDHMSAHRGYHFRLAVHESCHPLQFIKRGKRPYFILTSVRQKAQSTEWTAWPG